MQRRFGFCKCAILHGVGNVLNVCAPALFVTNYAQ